MDAKAATRLGQRMFDEEATINSWKCKKTQWASRLLPLIRSGFLPACKANLQYELLQSKPGKSQPSTPGRNVKRPQLSSQEPVNWNAEHQGALEQLITFLTNPPVLAYPDFNRPFTLHTDASEQGLGAVLYQRQNGKL